MSNLLCKHNLILIKVLNFWICLYFRYISINLLGKCYKMSKSIVMGVFQCCLFFCFQNSVQFISGECISFDTSVTQKIEYEGFHRSEFIIHLMFLNVWKNVNYYRELRWLIENSLVSTTQWDVTGCKMSLRLHINNGMFVNPDEVAELNRTGKVIVK